MNEPLPSNLTATQTPSDSTFRADFFKEAGHMIVLVGKHIGGDRIARIDMTSVTPSVAEFRPSVTAHALAENGFEIAQEDFDNVDLFCGWSATVDGWTSRVRPLRLRPPMETTYTASAYHAPGGVYILVAAEFPHGRVYRSRTERYPCTFRLEGVYSLSEFPVQDSNRRLIEHGWMPILVDGPELENGWHRHPYGLTIPVQPIGDNVHGPVAR